jgi:hypothetical protein
MNSRTQPYQGYFLLKILSIFMFLILAFSSSFAYATDIRGKINFTARNGIFPMNAAVVELCAGRDCIFYRTGHDGMYYFRAVAGNYNIVVNGRLITGLFIPNQQFFDIQPIIGN